MKKKCKRGILVLENYKKKWNSSVGYWDEKSLHDDSSHGADAFRILAISLKLAEKRGMTPEDLDVLRRKAGFQNYGFNY